MPTVVARSQAQSMTDLMRQRSEIGLRPDTDKGNICVVHRLLLGLDTFLREAIAIPAWSARDFPRSNHVDVVNIKRICPVPLAALETPEYRCAPASDLVDGRRVF